VHLVKSFSLNVSDIHYDISDVELYASYERQLRENAKKQADLQKQNVAAGDEVDPAVPDARSDGPLPKYGKNKSGRENVKQVQFRINVTRDGAVPIDLLPFDGNEAEVKTHVEYLDRLRKMLPTTKLVYAADTKFDSPENLPTNKAAGGQFFGSSDGSVRRPQDRGFSRHVSSAP